MKIRKLNAYYNGEWCGCNVVIKIPYLNLGNNYSMTHYVDELIACGHNDIIYHFDLDDNVRIVAQGNYGKVTLDTCGNDLMDHLRG